MPIPTLEKTWQILSNQPIGIITGGLNESVRYLMLQIKQRLTTVASGAWTVSGSSDSLSANMSGTDLWLDKDDIVWGTGVHSWIVLRQSALGTNFEICIDLNQASNDADDLTFVYSASAGFTGGTTSARPTATDEYVLGNQTDWGVGDLSSSNQNSNITYHMWQSTDGECTRVVFMWQDTVIGLWMFEKLRNPVPGFTDPHVVVYSCSSGGTPPSSALFLTLRDATTAANSEAFSRLPNGPTNTKVFLASEGTNQSALIEKRYTMNLVELEWPFYPISIVSIDSPNKARLGELYDIWFGNGGLNNLVGTTTAQRNGIVLPEDGTKTMAMFDSLLMPWDGTIPTTS